MRHSCLVWCERKGRTLPSIFSNPAGGESFLPAFFPFAFCFACPHFDLLGSFDCFTVYILRSFADRSNKRAVFGVSQSQTPSPNSLFLGHRYWPCLLPPPFALSRRRFSLLSFFSTPLPLSMKTSTRFPFYGSEAFSPCSFSAFVLSCFSSFPISLAPLLFLGL